jgi:plasmid stabilization system protein ParE
VTARPWYSVEARRDIEEIHGHYSEIGAHLADAFLAELDGLLDIIAESPEIYPIWFDDVRGVRLHHFPYNIIYHRGRRGYRIVGCFHVRRNPQRLRDRRHPRKH